MLAKVHSSIVIGVDGQSIEVEVDISSGLPVFATVGLPDGAVRESKDRVKVAIKNSGYDFPPKRITVNLAPADIKKVGSNFDLPIAVGVLVASGVIKSSLYKEYSMVGELSLDGSLRGVKGVLPMVLASKVKGLKGIIVPVSNSEEASLVEGIDVIAFNYLCEAVKFFTGEITSQPFTKSPLGRDSTGDSYRIDFLDVKGQENVKRALEIAASGGHNILMKGPPGSGKTMLSRRLPTILPDLTLEEAIETTKIHSVAGTIVEGMSCINSRPFRAPHHTISDAGLVGGGTLPKPGEV
ncbi:MAG: ATP-binding protein, partial [Desulfobacteraceae bacterium]|nr:ATP-binding protein [Desulfobacteraceae bacterium]